MVDLKGFFRKIGDSIGFHVPAYELTPERENEIIEKWAGNISKYGMELPALMFLWPLEPISTVIAYTAILPAAPVLDFLGLRGFEAVTFFSEHGNVKRLLKRIEELEDAKTKEKGFWK